MTYPWNAGDILTAADLNSEFGSKLNIAGGKILQIVRATDTTNRSTTSTSYVDVTGMSVTITPQKSDSAIILMAFGYADTSASSGSNFIGRIALTDNSNNTLSGAQDTFIGMENVTYSGTAAWYTSFVLVGYSTPATTSATTYKMRFRSGAATCTTRIMNANTTGQLYAIEVSA